MSIKNLRGHVFNPEVIRGQSAYEIAVMHGFEGTEEEWLESYVEGATKVAIAAANNAENFEKSSKTNAEIAANAANNSVNSALAARQDQELCREAAELCAEKKVEAEDFAEDAKKSAELAATYVPKDGNGVFVCRTMYDHEKGLAFVMGEGTKPPDRAWQIGDIIIDEFDAYVSRIQFIENGVPYIESLGFKMNGENGKDYVLTAEDKKEIASFIEETKEIPDYWIAELETKADAIQKAMETAGRNKSAFLWYTDAHWQSNSKISPVLLKYLVKNTPMNKVNFGGDIVSDPNPHNHENTKYIYEWRNFVSDLPNHHSVYGNHDVNHRSTDVSDMAYAHLLASEESADMVVGGDSYYYIDNPAEKTRYLYLSYFTNSHTDMLAQGEFIVTALSSVAEGWHIVVIAHRWWQYTSATAPTIGSVPAYEKEILSILDTYNARGTRSSSTHFSEQDFTKAKGKVEFCIGGHIHVDYDFESDGGIPIIITTADANQNRVPDSTVDSGTVGTITEAAVFGIIADYNNVTNPKITVVGVGRGTSRVVRASVVMLTAISNITYSGDTKVGATIDKSKFSFTANYSDGTTDTINGVTSVSPTTIGVVGDNSVTITYTEGTVTVSETITIVGTSVPVVNLLNLNRNYVAGTAGEKIINYLDESKAYTNVLYGSLEFSEKPCVVSDITENSVTVKEGGSGGITVAYALHLPDIRTKSYRLTFDYSGTGKCRTYYKYASNSANSTSNNDGFIDDVAGASGSADVLIPAYTDGSYDWLIILLGSNTSETKTFTNVSLTEA